jgi:hypothetical protein
MISPASETIATSVMTLISFEANQSLRFPSSSTYCIVPRPMKRRAMPAQSMCLRWRSAIACMAARTSSGSCTNRETIISEMIPIGTLMKKIHGQE